jgi:hypothetical protein
MTSLGLWASLRPNLVDVAGMRLGSRWRKDGRDHLAGAIEAP